MIFTTEINQQVYRFDSEHFHDLSIHQTFDDNQPNFFGVNPATCEPIKAGSFVGDTNQQGSCNVDQITIIPHCNGTHTESVNHLDRNQYHVLETKPANLVLAKLITVEPIPAKKSKESYHVPLEEHESFITKTLLENALSPTEEIAINACIIRTLPNERTKKNQKYKGDSSHPFLSNEAISYLTNSAIEHLLIDTPSIDRADDGRQLKNHRIFWGINKDNSPNKKQAKTITEMIYVDSEIADGYYLLTIQLPPFCTDAVPSRPIIYPITEIK